MWEKEKKAVFEASLKLREAGLVTGSQGNVSLKFKSANKVLVAITPTNINYDLMKTSDIVIIDASGKIVEGDLKPSIEKMLHLEIYARREDVGAIIHNHSVYATSLAVSGVSIPPILDDQVFYLGGEIAVAKHALPGSTQLVKNVAEAMGSKNAVLMANHGALAAGATMDKALFNCQLLERLSQVMIYSKITGNTRVLPADIISKEKKMAIDGGGGSI